MSTLKLSQLPPVMPPYHHSDLSNSLLPIIHHIQSVLGTIEQAYATFLFNQRDRLFSLKLHKSYMTEKMFIGVRIPRGMTDLQLNDWISDAIIASDSAVDTVRSKRITGAKRSILRESELYDLMPSRGVIIVEVDFDPEFIQADQNLNVFNPADTPERRPTEIVLYVKKGAGDTGN
jgi:type VI secretion system protein ImpJ